MATLTLAGQVEDDEAARDLLHDQALGHLDAATALRQRHSIQTTEASVRRWRSANGVSLVAPAPDLGEPGDDRAPILDVAHVTDETLSDENLRLRASNRALFARLGREKNRSEGLIQAVYDAARHAVDSAPVIASPVKPPADTRNKADEVAIWHTTDWQAAKTTTTYDSSVCERRVKQYVSKAQEITEVMRGDHPVRHGVVLATGDMLEGCHIFPGQEWEVDATLFDQIFFCANLLQYVIEQALATYETIDVVCEWGNHGRIGKKSDGFKASDNFDRILYEIVRTRMAHVERIRNFQVSDAWYQHFTVGEYSAMAIHGDEIKSFGGNIPAYGILKKANSWAGGVVEPFRDLYLGHYHQSMQLSMANGGNVFMTGSTESDNEFAREFVAATNDPSQRVNFVHPGKGFVTYESRIWVD